MTLRGYKHYPHSCCDVTRRIHFEYSIEEEAPDLTLERSSYCVYLSGFFLEEAKWPPFASFLFMEESFVMSSLRGFIVDLRELSDRPSSITSFVLQTLG